MRVPVAEVLIVTLLIAAGRATVPSQTPSKHFVRFNEIAAVQRIVAWKSPQRRAYRDVVIQPPQPIEMSLLTAVLRNRLSGLLASGQPPASKGLATLPTPLAP
jgi:hypothetical protein